MDRKIEETTRSALASSPSMEAVSLSSTAKAVPDYFANDLKRELGDPRMHTSLKAAPLWSPL